MEDIVAIKELANSKIIDILETLEIDFTDKYRYLNGPCPIHKGDRKDAWSWHIDRGIWKCYSKGCDSDYGADIFGLIQGLRHCTFVQAKNWLKQQIDCNLPKEEIKKLKDAKSNREFVNKIKKKERKSKVYSSSCLKSLSYHHYLEDRGFSPEIIQKYHVGVGKNAGKYMSNRIIFPILNIKGEIVGFTGRTLDKDWEQSGIPKWKHSLDFDAHNNLFNIFHAQESIRESSEAILVEGPLDILRLEEAGIHNAVAIFGKSLHNGQMDLLMKVSAFKLRFALDADTAGRSGTKKAVQLAKALFDVEVIELPEGKDCGDMSAEELRRILL